MQAAGRRVRQDLGGSSESGRHVMVPVRGPLFPWRLSGIPRNNGYTARPAPRRSGPRETPGARRRLMLIEDNAADVFFIKEALKHHGLEFDLEVIRDGAEALSSIRKTQTPTARPDIIVLDLNLPKCDGFEVLASIREHPVLKSVPVAIVTSSGSPEDRIRARRLGADVYVQKAFGLDEMLEIGVVLKKLLEEGRRA